MLSLRSPKGGCCSISDDLSCSWHHSFYLEKVYENFLHKFYTIALMNIDTRNIYQFLAIIVQNWTILPQNITFLTNLACQLVISYRPI